LVRHGFSDSKLSELFAPRRRKIGKAGNPDAAGQPSINRGLDDLGGRAATTDEVKELRREAQELKELVAEQTLELRLLKKSTIADGGDGE
jgi:hypothetical protein